MSYCQWVSLSVRVKPRNTSISIDLTNSKSLGQVKSGYILHVTKWQDKEIEIFKYTFYGILDAMWIGICMYHREV